MPQIRNRATAAVISVVVILLLQAAPLHAAERIVVVGGSLTEIVFALGAGPKVVGADTTSTWPPETENVEKVGYFRRLSAEGILSLSPDLVIADSQTGPETALRQLREAGVRIETAPDGDGLSQVVAKIQFVASVLDRQDEGEVLVDTFENQMARLQASLRRIVDKPRVVFLMSVARGSPMAAGKDNSANAIIELARVTNAITGFDGYKPLSSEALIDAAPEVVLMPAHALRSIGSPESVLERPGLITTPAGRNGKIIVMDGLKMLGFGLRTPEAIAELARALHPSRAEDIVF